jgi:hypothetical protein
MAERSRKTSWPDDDFLNSRVSNTPKKKNLKELLQSQVDTNYERKLLSKKLM